MKADQEQFVRSIDPTARPLIAVKPEEPRD